MKITNERIVSGSTTIPMSTDLMKNFGHLNLIVEQFAINIVLWIIKLACMHNMLRDFPTL
ncbi:hypothetical protein H312_00975 [Anncaliia algerae PRA339]|uniref:Uncharacterized protein n=1 Tax=Anncaliia algerae PRA339 TaxID=1288291 RepID=A0A059F3X9_9MICR|nr:hypothetical protein H312_00975 [Anncaliia algerae PRA339]